MHTAEGPFPMETTSWGDTLGGGTRMTPETEARRPALPRSPDRRRPPALRRADSKDLRRLSQILEASGESP
jgi:hypothetical protein